jgi:hypothetical protein
MTNDDLVYTAEVPDGFLLEHGQVPQDVWANIRHWLSSDVLPPPPSPPPPSVGDRRKERDALSALAHDAANTCPVRVPIPWEARPQTQWRRIAQFGNCRYHYASGAAVKCADARPPVPDYVIF